MGFMESLKKAFLYTGGVDNSESNQREEREEVDKPKPRLDIGNPLQRIKDIKATTANAFKNSQATSKPTISNYTRSLLYESMHNVVERKVNKGKPLVEAKLLYKRFLQDHVTDEAMYSDVDLEYIKVLIRHIKDLKGMKTPDNLSREDIIKSIINHPYLLNITEVLDVQAGYDMMKYFCELSYVICGFSYRGGDTTFSKLLGNKVPHFHININDSTFTLLNEVKSLISDESSLEDKKKYIADKVSPLLSRYVILNDVPTELLYTVLTMFDKLDNSSNDGQLDLFSSDHDGSFKLVGEETEVLSEEDIQERMFEGIKNDINPITTLKRESTFCNVYSELADPRNPDVTIEELEEAVQDINHMIDAEEFELSPEEFKIFSTIKGRLKLMKGGLT